MLDDECWVLMKCRGGRMGYCIGLIGRIGLIGLMGFIRLAHKANRAY